MQTTDWYRLKIRWRRLRRNAIAYAQRWKKRAPRRALTAHHLGKATLREWDQVCCLECWVKRSTLYYWNGMCWCSHCLPDDASCPR